MATRMTNPLPLIVDTTSNNVVGYVGDDQDAHYGALWSAVPVAADSVGEPGQVAYDATAFYVCIASGQWVKCTLATWS